MTLTAQGKLRQPQDCFSLERTKRRTVNETKTDKNIIGWSSIIQIFLIKVFVANFAPSREKHERRLKGCEYSLDKAQQIIHRDDCYYIYFKILIDIWLATNSYQEVSTNNTCCNVRMLEQYRLLKFNNSYFKIFLMKGIWFANKYT